MQKRMEARLATLVLLEDGNPYGRPCWIARGFDVIVLDMPGTIVGFDVGTVNVFIMSNVGESRGYIGSVFFARAGAVV